MARSSTGTAAEVVKNTAFSYDYTNAFTMAGWGYPRTYVNAFNTLVIGGSATSIRFHNASDVQFQILSVPIIAGTVPLGAWYHLAITFPGSSGTGHAYVNGSSVGTITPGTFHSETTVQILNDQFANTLDGSAADIGIWNVELTTAEVNALAKGARPYAVRPTGLIGYWPLDGIESPEPDLSGFAHNGTVTGATLAAGPPIMPFTPRWPQPDTFVPPVIKWEIFMRHSMLPMLLAANPNMSRREALAALGLAGV